MRRENGGRLKRRTITLLADLDAAISAVTTSVSVRRRSLAPSATSAPDRRGGRAGRPHLPLRRPRRLRTGAVHTHTDRRATTPPRPQAAKPARNLGGVHHRPHYDRSSPINRKRTSRPICELGRPAATQPLERVNRKALRYRRAFRTLEARSHAYTLKPYFFRTALTRAVRGPIAWEETIGFRACVLESSRAMRTARAVRLSASGFGLFIVSLDSVIVAMDL